MSSNVDTQKAAAQLAKKIERLDDATTEERQQAETGVIVAARALDRELVA